MKEFIDKLISRLEEYKKQWMDADYLDGIDEIIEIVNQLAEEYKDKDCSECSRRKWYQIGYADAENKLAEEYKSGWIPCSEKLPEHMQQCFTTARIYFVPDHVDEPNNYIGVELNTYSKDYGWLYNPEVIAWRPLPQPYEKGE